MKRRLATDYSGVPVVKGVSAKAPVVTYSSGLGQKNLDLDMAGIRHVHNRREFYSNRSGPIYGWNKTRTCP